MIELIKTYSAELANCRSLIREYKKMGQDTSFLEGQVAALESVVKSLKEKALLDRFFLEEIVKKIMDDDKEHYETLAQDFLSELVNGLPLTEQKRKSFIKNILGFEDTDYYFSSEKELVFFLHKKRLPNEDEMNDLSYVLKLKPEVETSAANLNTAIDYSIVDKSKEAVQA